MPDLEPAEADREPTVLGATRRGMLRGAAGIGAAGLTAGALAAAVTGAADAATTAHGEDDARGVTHDEPLIVHVHDARTGVFDLYTGERHVRFTDRQLAARLARAAGLAREQREPPTRAGPEAGRKQE